MPVSIFEFPRNAQIKMVEQMEPIQQLGFSTLSNRAKNLVTSSNLHVTRVEFQFFRRLPDITILFKNRGAVRLFFRVNAQQNPERIVYPQLALIPLSTFDVIARKKLDGKDKFVFRKPEFDFRDYLDHFHVGRHTKIDEIVFITGDFAPDSIKSNLARIDIDVISIPTFCSHQFSREILTLLTAVPKIDILRDPYQNISGTHGFLMGNLAELHIRELFWFTLNDLLITNSECIEIRIKPEIFNEAHINKFLKLWIHGSNPRIKQLTLRVFFQPVINEDVVLNGIQKYLKPRDADQKPFENRFDIRRKDGTLAELAITNSTSRLKRMVVLSVLA